MKQSHSNFKTERDIREMIERLAATVGATAWNSAYPGFYFKSRTDWTASEGHPEHPGKLGIQKSHGNWAGI
jgi:hypothetical protein